MSKTTVVAAALAVGAATVTFLDRDVWARSASTPGMSVTPQYAESAADRMPMAEFKRLFDAGAVVVLDVRGSAPYRDGHIPGSISVPLDTVGQRAAEWRNEARPIVTYCSWPDEHTSARAALLLKTGGVKKAYALLGGYNAWVVAGHPVARGDK